MPGLDLRHNSPWLRTEPGQPAAGTSAASSSAAAVEGPPPAAAAEAGWTAAQPVGTDEVCKEIKIYRTIFTQ